jgi:hypothetical protein
LRFGKEGVMEIQRFGKILELEGYGQVLEILPFIFSKSGLGNSSSPNWLFFDRFANVVHDQLEDRIPLEDEIFEAARSLLVRRLGHPDLAPGFDLGQDEVGFAALIASAVHLEQKDKLGFPYIEHPRRVFLNSEWSLKPEDLSESERVVGYQAAWLHDALEDSSEYFYRELEADDLLAWGFSSRVVSVVSKLTRSENGNLAQSYYREILLDTTARAVKLADIADNLAAWRVKYLDETTKAKLEKKYDKALSELHFDDELEDGWFGLRLDFFDQGAWPQFARRESAHRLRQLEKAPRVREQYPDRIITEGSENWMSKVFREAQEILETRPWDSATDSRDLPYGFTLEAWYSAVLLLLVKASREGDMHQLDFELLSSLTDGMDRNEVSFQFGGVGTLPRSFRVSDLQLAISDTHLLLRKVMKASRQFREDSMEQFEAVEAVLVDAEILSLFALMVLAFDQRAIPWLPDLRKVLLIGLERRAAR